MKTLRVLALSAAVLAVASPAFADERVVTDEGVATFSFFKPAQVRAEVGTTGYGGAISYNVNPHVGLTLGYNGGDISWSDDISVNGATYDLDMDNNTAYLNAEIRPWANWFYIAAGTGYLDNDYGLKAVTDGTGTIKINGENYQAATGTTGTITGKMKYKNNIAPYLGLGFSPSITDRWGVFGELGAFYTGNPEVELVARNLVDNTGTAGMTAQQAANEDARKIRNDDKYKWAPVAKVGLSFRF
ncbi:ornithine uptake porin CarO [Alkanindiges sp. WGS2144]|uniref:ornithine uptake porin CarO n=1 Tax=Alkanindiges sp. WGS2144 TaxID=3366808 RepID=UPI003753391E